MAPTSTDDCVWFYLWSTWYPNTTNDNKIFISILQIRENIYDYEDSYNLNLAVYSAKSHNLTSQANNVVNQLKKLNDVSTE